MSFTQQLQSFNATDEWYTPKDAVELILPYIPQHSTIWCPFDKAFSQYVQVFTTGGHKVICSHIDNGQDFFLYEPHEHYDFIISNPPYSKKEDVFQRLFVLGKPFGMLVNFNGIFDSAKRFGMFRKYGVQLLVPKQRTRFISTENSSKNSPPFKCLYVCWKLLPKDIVFEQEENGLFDEVAE